MDSLDIESKLEETKSESICRSVSLQSIATISSKSSNDSKDSIFCRICHQNETSDTESPDLISPCKCMGSMANVHQHCLQRWASITSTSSCDICGYAYKCRQKFPTLSQVNSISIIFTYFENIFVLISGSKRLCQQKNLPSN